MAAIFVATTNVETTTIVEILHLWLKIFYNCGFNHNCRNLSTTIVEIYQPQL